MMDTPTTELRQKAIDWQNSNRDIDKGIAILKDAGYKPHVMANFEKNKTRQDIPKKLLFEMRNYVRYCTNPGKNEAIHEDEPPLTDPEEKFETNIDQELQKEYPATVKRLLTECRELYVERSKQHTALKNVGEANDDKSMTERKQIGLIIDATSRRMDTLWRAFDEYKKSGSEPDASLFEKPFNPEAIVSAKSEKKETELILPDDMDKLKKMSENWRTKLLKAENRLEFQSDKKESKPNPMPAGPKRISQEKRIAKLKEEKNAMDTKIAELK